MSQTVFHTNLRLNLDNEDDRRAWEHLQDLRTRYKSYSRAVVAVINGYFNSKEQMNRETFLESKEKEDAFLQRVFDTIKQGFDVSSAAGDCSNSVERQPPHIQVPADSANQEMENTVLEFIDSL